MPAPRLRAYGAIHGCALLLSHPLAVHAQAHSAADAVQAGRMAYDRADFELAIASFQRALVDPSASQATLVDAHTYLAVLFTGMGDADRAEAHLVAALAIDPGLALPSGASPVLVAVYDRLRAERHGARATARVELPTTLPAGTSVTVRMGARDVPAEFDGRVVGRCVRGDVEIAALDVSATAGGAVSAGVHLPALEAGAHIECVATLETSQGVVIDRSTGRADVALVAATTSPVRASLAAMAPRRVTPHRERRRDPPVGLYVGLAVGTAAVIAAAVITTVIVLARPTQAEFGAPQIAP